jgi:hypothetical protein
LIKEEVYVVLLAEHLRGSRRSGDGMRAVIVIEDRRSVIALLHLK